MAVLKACPVSHPIRCCSHNRPPLGSSALGMSKSYIGIQHRAGADKSVSLLFLPVCQNNQASNLTRAPDNRYVGEKGGKGGGKGVVVVAVVGRGMGVFKKKCSIHPWSPPTPQPVRGSIMLWCCKSKSVCADQNIVTIQVRRLQM